MDVREMLESEMLLIELMKMEVNEDECIGCL